MLKKSLNYDYDIEKDILLLYSNEEYKSSIELYGLIVDFNLKNEIKGIEIHEASKIFSEISGKKISKKILSEIISSSLDFRSTKKMLIANFSLETKKESFLFPLTMDNPYSNLQTS